MNAPCRQDQNFGHCKVSAKLEHFATFFAGKSTFIARTGCAPSRWGIGLTVLLEKIAGIALVNKLRAILLSEADSNMFNCYVFDQRAMEIMPSPSSASIETSLLIFVPFHLSTKASISACGPSRN
jgi:hypothetical protein